jgi:hypothetical protein
MRQTQGHKGNPSILQKDCAEQRAQVSSLSSRPETCKIVNIKLNSRAGEYIFLTLIIHSRG